MKDAHRFTDDAMAAARIVLWRCANLSRVVISTSNGRGCTNFDGMAFLPSIIQDDAPTFPNRPIYTERLSGDMPRISLSSVI